MIDPRSLFLAGALTSLVCAGMLFTSRRLHPESTSGMKSATLASLCMGTSMLLIALRSIVPDVVSITLANAFGMIGGLLVFDTSRRITGFRPLSRLNAIAVTVIIGAQVVLGTGTEYHLHRIVSTSIVQGGFVAASIPLLWHRLRVDPPAPIAWAIGCSTVFALGHAARLVHTAITGVSVNGDGMVGGNLTIGLMVLFFSVAPMIFAMSLIGLVNGRLGLDLHRIATTDALSGLMNRRTFFSRAPRYFERSDPLRPLIAVMMIDIDRFKAINDRYGHAAGDDVITDIGRALVSVAPADSLVARYGGEEFCLLAQVTSDEDAVALAERLRRTLARRHAETPGPAIRYTASVGVAVAPADGATIDAVLLVADRRVYVAKACGRNLVVANDTDVAPDEKDATEKSMITV